MKHLREFSFFVLGLIIFGSGCASSRVETAAPLARPISGVARTDVKGAETQIHLKTAPSAELTLRKEATIPEYCDLVQRWDSMAQTTNWATTVRNGVPARVAIREISGNRNGTVYVCIPGLFGESQNYKYIVAAFEEEQEFWLIDPPGFGLSDCPSPALVGAGGYSPEALAERILQALNERLEARPDVKRIIITATSYGGMVALRMFINDELRGRYSGVLSKVQGMTLFAPCDVAITHITDTWKAFFAINSVKAGIGGWLRIVQEKITRSVEDTFCNPELASRELAQSGIHVICDRKAREATQAVMREAFAWTKFMEEIDQDAAERLELGYANVSVPCLIVWGMRDTTLPINTGHKITNLLPDARMVTIPQSKHLLIVERPVMCADLMREFTAKLEDGNLGPSQIVQRIEPYDYPVEKAAYELQTEPMRRLNGIRRANEANGGGDAP